VARSKRGSFSSMKSASTPTGFKPFAWFFSMAVKRRFTGRVRVSAMLQNLVERVTAGAHALRFIAQRIEIAAGLLRSLTLLLQIRIHLLAPGGQGFDCELAFGELLSDFGP